MSRRIRGPWEVAAYRAVLRMLPRDLARAHRDDMIALFRDRLAEGGADRRRRLGLLLAATWGAARHGASAWGDARRLRMRRRSGHGGSTGMGAMRDELRVALRSLVRRPLFAMVAVVTLALGIGASTAIFTIADTLLFRALPVPEPERLVQVAASDVEGDLQGLLAPMVDLMREERVFAAVCGALTPSVIVEMGGRIDAVETHAVTGDCFTALALRPTIGRLLEPADERLGAPHVVVLAHDTWMRVYGGSSAALEQTINVDGVAYTIVGVTPAGFRGLRVGFPARLFIPLANFERGLGAYFPPRALLPMTVFGRLGPDMPREELEARLSTRWPLWRDATIPPQWTAAQRGRYVQRELRILPLRGTFDTALRERLETPLLALLAIAALVLVATCVNLAHLSLTRSAARARELSVRAALGASGARLARGAALESALILTAGAVAALAIAFGLDALLVRTFASASPNFALDVTPNRRAIAFTALASVVAFALFALVPAWRAGRADALTLASASSRLAGGHRRVRRVAIVTQVALTVVLVAAGSLCLEAVWRLRTDPLGISTDGVLSAQLSPLPGGYDDGNAGNAYYQALLDRVAAEPGVEAAALSYHAILADASWSVNAGLPGADTEVAVDQSFVTGGFFAAMKIPFVVGGTFGGRDPGAGRREVVLSEATARALFGTTDVVGRTVRIGRSAVLQSAEVVGVARDAVLSSPKTRNTRVVYLSFWQFGPVVQLYPTLLARARTGTAPTADALRRVVAAGGVEYVSRIRTLDDQRDMTLVQELIVSRLSAMFAALGLALAGIGLYALVGLAVTEREAEFGIRRAVGGSAGHVVSLVLRDGFSLVAVGALLGAPAAWAVCRVGAHLLRADAGANAMAMAVALLLVLLVALCAAWRPARRASTVDPLLALRP